MKDKTWLWRIMIGACVSSALLVSGWALSAVANMPKEYTSKEELQQLRKENREDHREIIKEIRRLHTGS